MEGKIYLTDIFNLIHFTIIEKTGENFILLEEIRKMDRTVRNGSLENLEVTDTKFFKDLFESRLNIPE